MKPFTHVADLAPSLNTRIEQHEDALGSIQQMADLIAEVRTQQASIAGDLDRFSSELNPIINRQKSVQLHDFLNPRNRAAC